MSHRDTKATILGSDDLRTQIEDVPEWGDIKLPAKYKTGAVVCLEFTGGGKK